MSYQIYEKHFVSIDYYYALYIGLMRNGILVEEGSPRDILTKYGADSLEASFLILCRAKKTNEVLEFSLLNTHRYIYIFIYLCITLGFRTFGYFLFG